MSEQTPRAEMSDLEAAQPENLQQVIDDLVRELATANARLERLRNALIAAKLSHQACEDCWYSCPKSEDGCCNENAGTECTCGADRHNAAIDEALRAELEKE